MRDGGPDASVAMPTIDTPMRLPCGMTLPNRLCKAAMTEALSDHLNRPTPELCRLYERWAHGGTGLLVTGNIQVDRRYLERPGNVCIDGAQDEEQRALLASLARAGKAKDGSRIIVQLGHAGRQSHGWVNLEPAGAGNVPLENPHGLPSLLARGFFGKPRAFSAPEVEGVVQRFAHAAAVCLECGFDGVQIHAAHGYLLSAFLNPRANNRDAIFGKDDPYGGTLAQRARPLLDVVRAVRAAVRAPRANFLISVKLNSADFQEGGFTADEATTVAQWLEAEGVDLLEVSGGNYESGIFGAGDDSQATQTSAPLTEVSSARTAQREAYFLEYASRMTRALTTTPVMVTGGWRTRRAMDAALRTEAIAMIGLGRPLCGDPDGSRKLLTGEIAALPRYEDELQVGYASLGWLFRLLPAGLQRVLKLGSLQSWYYISLVQMAERGSPGQSRRPFLCFLVNEWREARLASKMTEGECAGLFKWRPGKQPRYAKLLLACFLACLLASLLAWRPSKTRS